MTDQETGIPPSEREEVEAMLPWYATGRLSAEECVLVERWLQRDAALRGQLELIEEDRQATVMANEAVAVDPRLGAIFAERLARHPAPATGPAATRMMDAVLAFFAALSPRRAALAAAGALLVILVQGAIIIGGYFPFASPGEYRTASGPSPQPRADLIVGFRPDAPLAEMISALQEAEATIVLGPLPGNLFKVDVGARQDGSPAIARATRILKARADIVTLVLQTAPPEEK